MPNNSTPIGRLPSGASAPRAASVSPPNDAAIQRWVRARFGEIPFLHAAEGHAYYDEAALTDLATLLQLQWHVSNPRDYLIAALQAQALQSVLEPLSKVVPKGFVRLESFIESIEDRRDRLRERRAISQVHADFPASRDEWTCIIPLASGGSQEFISPKVHDLFPGYFLWSMDHRGLRALMATPNELVQRVARDGKLPSGSEYYFIAREDATGVIEALRIVSKAEYEVWDKATPDKLAFVVRRVVPVKGGYQVVSLNAVPPVKAPALAPAPVAPQPPVETPAPPAPEALKPADTFTKSLGSLWTIKSSPSEFQWAEGQELWAVGQLRTRDIAVELKDHAAYRAWLGSGVKTSNYVRIKLAVNADGSARIMTIAGTATPLKEFVLRYVVRQLQQIGESSTLDSFERRIVAQVWDVNAFGHLPPAEVLNYFKTVSASRFLRLVSLVGKITMDPQRGIFWGGFEYTGSPHQLHMNPATEFKINGTWNHYFSFQLKPTSDNRLSLVEAKGGHRLAPLLAAWQAESLAAPEPAQRGFATVGFLAAPVLVVADGVTAFLKFIKGVNMPRVHGTRKSEPVVSSRPIPLPEAVHDFQASVSWFHDGPPALEQFATQTVSGWAASLQSANPFVTLAALSQLSWNAGQIIRFRRHLHDNHMPSLVNAVLAIAENPEQLQFVRRAAIRAAAMIAPQESGPRLAHILINYREDKELRIAAAEAYYGEKVPEKVAQTLQDIIFDYFTRSPSELVVAALRTWPYYTQSVVGSERLIHFAFKFGDTRVYDAAVDAIQVSIRNEKNRDTISKEVAGMLDRVRSSIETIAYGNSPSDNKGLYVAERLGTLVVPMLESLMDPQQPRYNQNVARAVLPVLARIRAGSTTPHHGTPEINPVDMVSMLSPEAARIRQASLEELVAIVERGDFGMAERVLVAQRFREFGPAGWRALEPMVARAGGVRWGRALVEAMGADAVYAFPHLAPHGAHGRFESRETLGWRVGADAILKQFKK